MYKLNLKTNKYNSFTDFNIFYDSDIDLISSLKIPEIIRFYRADKFDSKFINSNDDLWVFMYSGKEIKVNFKQFNIYEKKLAKLFLVHYIQINTPSNIEKLTYTLNTIFILLKNKRMKFTYSNCKLILINLAEDDQYQQYYHFKFLIKIMFLEGSVNFDINKEYELEFIQRPKSFNSSKYYEEYTDTISYPIIIMIQQGFSKLLLNLETLDEKTLLHSSILGLVYTSGLRPVQLAKLSVQDISQDSTRTEDNFHRYSVLIPYAKQARYVHEKIAIKLPEEIAKIILAYIKKFNLYPTDKLFKMGNNAAQFCSEAINTQLFKFSPEQYQKGVITGEILQQKYSFSDFRHHIGYSLAMDGASAEEIAYILGHSSLVTARHYIFSSPELAQIRAQALGRDSLYKQMIAMLLTGRLAYRSKWPQKKVIGNIGDQIHYDIGGCAYPNQCLFIPVRNCYGCMYFHPFIDFNHNNVLESIQNEINNLIKLSDSIGISRNPLIRIHESTKFEIESVISRCAMYQDKNQ